MKIHVIPAGQLSSDHLAAWSRLQRADTTLANPFFRPEFTQAVSAVRGNVDVAVWEQAGEPVGFLPFQRNGRGSGLPVGSPMNDFQGAIVRNDVEWSPQDVVRAARLRSWKFDHLVASQQAFAPFQYIFDESPYIDLSQGYDAYLETRSRNFVKKTRKAERKAQEIGEVRFEISNANRDALAQLVQWKTEKCRRTNLPDTFAKSWSLKLVEYILAHPAENFSGALVCLYIGKQLGSVEFVIRSGHILHEWLSAYNVELADCSPGLLMEVKLGRIANSLGITRIDLGKGEEQYKQWYASGFDRLAEGTVHARPLQAPFYRAWSVAKNRLRATPLRGGVRRVRRWTLSTRIWLGLTD